MIEYKIFIKRIGILGFSNILLALSSIILIPILTKNFSITEYGIWVQINTLIALIPNLTTLGLPYTMVRFLSAETDKEKIKDGFYSILTIILLFNVVASIILFLFSEMIANALFDGDIIVVQISTLIIFITCMDIIFLNYFRTFQQIKRYSILSLFQTYSGVILVSILAIYGFNVEIAAWGFFLSKIISFIIMAFIIFSEIGISIPKFTHLKEYLSFGIPTVPGSLSFWIVESSDRFLIGLLLGTAFVGYYAPGYVFGNIIVMLLSPFSLLLPAVLTKYYEENKIKEINIFIKYSLKFFILVAVPSVVGISFLSKPLLYIITTPEIAAQGYLVTPFVATSAFLFGLYGLIMNLIVLEKKTKVIGIAWIIAAIINILLNIVLILPLGIIGSAIATLLSYSVAFSIIFIYSRKNFDIDFEMMFLVKCVVSATTMGALLVLIDPHNIIEIIISILLSIVVYFTLMYISKGFEKYEISFIKKLIKNE